MGIERVTILEFAPTADEIWRIPKHSRDGYTNYDPDTGLVSILDTDHDAKPRPEILAIYAGGKATNVARVMDRLLEGENTSVIVELVTFLPPPNEAMRQISLGARIQPSTPAGIYVQCLQISDLLIVKPRFVIVDELEEVNGMQTTRRCIEITLKDSNSSLNFSPRIVWSQKSADAVMSKIASIVHDTDMLVIAGAPPVWEVKLSSDLAPHNFYARILGVVDPDCMVSIDVRGNYLHECLIAKHQPRLVFMNTDEFSEAGKSWKELSQREFPGTLIVHDKDGCRIWDRRLPDAHDLFSETQYFPSPKVDRIYSTIGAGDAMHAGFLKEWIFSKSENDRLQRSVIFSQAVAAMSVSNEKATHGIDAKIIKK